MDIAEIFDQTLHDVPYNSFGKTLLASGQTYPERLGGNCVFQCQSFVDKIIGAGYNQEITFLTAQEKPHWVTVCKDEKDLQIYDPFLLHIGPLSITKVLREGEVVIPAYPNLGEHSSHIHARRISGNEIRVALRVFRGKFKSVLEYTYDVTDTHSTLPPKDYQTLAGLRQNKLELGLLDDTNSVHRMYCYPENGHKSVIKIGEKGVCEHKDPELFHKRVAEIAAMLHIDLESFLSFWEQGRNEYNRRQVG